MFGLPRITGFERKLWDDNYATLLIGPKRVGKSTALAMIARQGIAAGYTVYSNYPIDGTIKVPKVVTKDGKTVTDKTFLYDNPLLQKSIILLDEVSNIWNNRSWGKWTEDDSDFFNYLGKNDTRVFMAVQYYDMVDLNVKRNTDATWFFTRSLWPNTTIVECDIQRVCKVENIQTHVLDSRFRQVTFEPCVIPDGRYYFRRKRWYPYFLTLYKDERLQREWLLDAWHDLCFTPPPDAPEGGAGEAGEEAGLP